MSWDKNTVVHSEVSSVMRVLDDLKVPYILETLGQVVGCGLNDSDNATYPIRKLTYGDVVILEQMIREDDCDMDDVIVSQRFQKDDVPTDWPLEIMSEGWEYYWGDKQPQSNEGESLVTFEPELGQLCFGNVTYDIECPEYVENGLRVLSDAIAAFRGNAEDSSPADNVGDEFKNDLFEMRSYYWGECVCGWEDIAEQRPAFHADSCFQNRIAVYDKTLPDKFSQKSIACLVEWSRANGGPDAGFMVYCDCGGDQKAVEWLSNRALGPQGHKEDCPIVIPNFRGGDFEVNWYKYLGRGTSMNRQISKEEFDQLLGRCLGSLEKEDEKGKE